MMLLSIQQRYILETVRKLRCLRDGQLLLLVREQFRKCGMEITEKRMTTMLRQLCGISNDIRIEKGLVYLAGVRPDMRCIEAIDVMLELSKGAPDSFGCTNMSVPLLLRFSVGDIGGPFFTVGTLSSAGREHLYWLENSGPGRVIWISDTGTPPEGLALPAKHFFAARQADGTHRFYGPHRL